MKGENQLHHTRFTLGLTLNMHDYIAHPHLLPSGPDVLPSGEGPPHLMLVSQQLLTTF